MKLNSMVTAAAAAAGIVGTIPAGANPIAEFYQGRTVTVLVASLPDGMAGFYGRVVGDNFGRNIPGKPTTIVQFMAGSGGTKGANYCYSVAPKDGTTVCQLSPTVPMAQLLQGTGVKYDASKFNWLGQSADQNGAITVTNRTPVKTLLDVKMHEVQMGATGKASETYLDPTLVNGVLGTRFKPIMGYRSGGEIDLAIERGEVQGKAGPIISYLIGNNFRKYEAGEWRILAQLGLRKHPKFPGIPLLSEFAPDEESRQLVEFVAARAQVGRAFVAPPGVPAERVTALRKVFDVTMEDPLFLAEAGKRNLEINPSTGAEVEKVVARILATPPAVIERARRLLAAGG